MKNSDKPLKTPKILPFLKWAGGKRWLVEKHGSQFPTSFNKYYEPFLGSASVFFHLQPQYATLSDMNGQLIECYKEIRDNPDLISELLELHQAKHNKDYYYEIRAESYKMPHERAAQFIYLNRTCFNGLYRVNLKGNFNVPIGTKNTVILPSDNFSMISEVLKNKKIVQQDFAVTINMANDGDFVYVDPPYTVKHNFNGFLKYNEKIFSWEDQIRLKDCCVQAAERGAKILVSNAAHESVIELYSGCGRVSKISRNSVLSAKSSARGVVDEILVELVR